MVNTVFVICLLLIYYSFFPSGCIILIQGSLSVLSQTIKLFTSYEMFFLLFSCVILSKGIFFTIEGTSR